MLETSKHLYQSPLYHSENGDWSTSYEEVISQSKKLTIDNTSITSMLSFGQISHNRTLFQEVKRLPWLSKINDAGEIVLEDIPKHDYYIGE